MFRFCGDEDKNTREGGLWLPKYLSQGEKDSPWINLPAQETVTLITTLIWAELAF